MNKYLLSCCSTSDLNVKHYKDRGIRYICFHYFLDGIEHKDDFGETLPISEFYKKMEQGAMTKTSQLNAQDYYNYFENLINEGYKEILHLTLSSGISGTINSAKIAVNMIEEKYKDVKIYIVDSLAASSGYGLLMDKLADLRDEGKSIEEVRDWAENNRLSINHWFFSTDLKYFVRGGRISKTSGFFGNMLHVCPLLNVNDEGKLIPREKIIGKKKVINAIFQKMIENAKDGKDYNDYCYISHSAVFEDAKAVKDKVEEAFPNLKGKVEIFDIGTTIGSHTGPGTVALFFVGKERSK